MKKIILFVFIIFSRFTFFSMEFKLIYQTKISDTYSIKNVYINDSPFYLNDETLLLYNDKKIFLYNINESEIKEISLSLFSDIQVISSILKTSNDNEVIITYLNEDRKKTTKRIIFESKLFELKSISDEIDVQVYKNSQNLDKNYSLVLYTDKDTNKYSIDAFLAGPAFKCGITNKLSKVSNQDILTTLETKNGDPVYVMDYWMPYVDVQRKKIIVATDLTQPNDFSMSSVDYLQLYIYEWN